MKNRFLILLTIILLAVNGIVMCETGSELSRSASDLVRLEITNTDTTANSDAGVKFRNADGDSLQINIANNSNGEFFLSDGGEYHFYIGNEKKMFIDSNGNLRIPHDSLGFGWYAPTSRLSVKGLASSSGNTSDGIELFVTPEKFYNLKIVPYLVGNGKVGYQFRTVSILGGSNTPLSFDNTGNVGVGIDMPKSFSTMLNVGKKDATSINLRLYNNLMDYWDLDINDSGSLGHYYNDSLRAILDSDGNFYTFGDLAAGGDWSLDSRQAIGQPGEIAFDWTEDNSYNTPQYHGIQSKGESGSWNDDLRINSYNDIINTLDANNNNPTSHFKVQQHSSTDGEDLFWVRSDDGRAYFKGDVGIGTNSPQGHLHVSNTATDESVDFYLTGGFQSSGGITLGNIYFGSGEGGPAYQAASIKGIAEKDFNDSDWPSALAFYTTQDGSGTPQERVRIDSDGNVGIGETSPLRPLTIKDTGYLLMLEGSGDVDNKRYSFYQDSDRLRLIRTNDDDSYGQDLITFKGGGNVGIGTTEPNALLDVYGNFRVSNNSSAYFDLGDGETEFVVNADEDDYIVVDADNEELELVTDGGEVGIGTVEPGAKLDVGGNTTIDGVLRAKNWTATHPTNGEDRWETEYTDGSTLGDWGYNIHDVSNNIDRFWIERTSTLGTGKIIMNGSVGIGTIEPNALLDVYGNFRVSGNNDVYFDLGDGETEFVVNADEDDYIVVDADNEELELVTDGGEVGIGTTGPSYKLDVDGDVNLGNSVLRVAGSVGSDGQVLTSTGSAVAWQDAEGGSSLWTESGSDIYYEDGNVGIGTTYTGATLEVGKTGDTGGLSTMVVRGDGEEDDIPFEIKTQLASGYSWDSRFRVQGNGDIGIGTIYPNATLDVCGDFRVSGNNDVYFDLGDDSREFVVNADGDDYIVVDGDDEELELVTSGKKVGINTSDPDSLLTVDGSAHIEGNVLIGGKLNVTGAVDPTCITYTPMTREKIQNMRYGDSQEVAQFWNTNTQMMEIYHIKKDEFYNFTGEKLQ